MGARRLVEFAAEAIARVVNSDNKELRRDPRSGVLSDLVGVFNREGILCGESARCRVLARGLLEW